MVKGKIKLFGILALLATSLILGGSIYIKSSEIKEQEEEAEALRVAYADTGNSMRTFLNIKKYDADGNLVYEMMKENDLLLDNFGRIFQFAFRDAIFKDDQGHSISPDMLFENSNYYQDYIALGTGTTAATISDYKLETEVVRPYIYYHDWQESGTQFNVTFTAFYTFTSSHAITEAGLCNYEPDLNDEVFYTRDVFSAVNVVATDTLAVTIIFQFN